MDINHMEETKYVMNTAGLDYNFLNVSLVFDLNFKY